MLVILIAYQVNNVFGVPYAKHTEFEQMQLYNNLPPFRLAIYFHLIFLVSDSVQQTNMLWYQYIN